MEKKMATEKQIAFINKLAGKEGINIPEDLTCYGASKVIESFLHMTNVFRRQWMYNVDAEINYHLDLLEKYGFFGKGNDSEAMYPKNEPKTKAEDEYIVERYDKLTKNMHVVGKVLGVEEMNDEVLETIWDLGQWGVNGRECLAYNGGVYDGMPCYMNDGITYIPMTKESAFNDDVFIRKHYEVEKGYAIINNHRTTKDEWMFVSRKDWLTYMRNWF